MKIYGLIGEKLGHSFSQKYFSDKFEQESFHDCVYQNFELASIDLFPELIQNNTELYGLNVTIPYKTAIIPYLDELSPVAKAIGAVNTIEFKRENGQVRLIGHNTDVIGFKDSLRPLLKGHHHKALILGKGGAAKAVEYVLKEIGLEVLFVSSSNKPGTIPYETLNDIAMQTFKVIINCSPVGTYPNVDDAPNIPYEHITDDHLLYDLIYNPPVTKFLKHGQEKGALIQNGYPMLTMQAEAAWKIWNQTSN